MVAPWGPRAGLGCSCSCSWQGAVPACPLSLLWLCRGWPGPLGGFSTPSHRILRSASSPMPCKVHALAGKWPHVGGKSVCLLFTLLQPHPGTSSPRHSSVGYILVRAEGSTAKQPHIGSGLAQGQRVGSGPLLSTPRASLLLGPHTWFIQGRS